MKIQGIALALCGALAFGCSSPDLFNERNQVGYEQVKDADLIASSHRAAESLMEQASYLQTEHRAILITSMAHIVDLKTSSALGLTVSEQIADRFAQYGFPVVDLRARDDIHVKEKSGEYILSRDVRQISDKHNAAAVLLGTYSVGSKTVFVNTRLVRPDDNRVLASYDFELPLGPDTKRLVQTETGHRAD